MDARRVSGVTGAQKTWASSRKKLPRIADIRGNCLNRFLTLFTCRFLGLVVPAAVLATVVWQLMVKLS